MTRRELTLQERCEHYQETFPDWVAPRVVRGRIEGVWVLGNDYRRRGPARKLYGAYPPNYLKRVEALFPDLHCQRLLHLFSGSLEPGPYVRADALQLADVRCDAQALPFRDGVFGWCCGDPPYSVEDAKRYQVPMPDRRKVLPEVHRVLRSGGWLIWLDTIWPIHKTQDVWALRGHIAIVRSQNHRVRLVTLLQKI